MRGFVLVVALVLFPLSNAVGSELTVKAEWDGICARGKLLAEKRQMPDSPMDRQEMYAYLEMRCFFSWLWWDAVHNPEFLNGL